MKLLVYVFKSDPSNRGESWIDFYFLAHHKIVFCAHDQVEFGL